MKKLTNTETLKWGIDNAKLCAKIYWQKRMNPVIK
jgi:hypothetical protein